MVGASGSGKSTLGRAIAGLIPEELPGEWQGTLEVDDLVLPSASRAAVTGRVGMVFQDPGSQLVMERVEDDVAFGLENRAWPADRMRARVPEALAQMGLAGMERRRTGQLSGGQQQRLALAGVLAARPGVLVLDEPTANLDPDGTAAVFDLLGRIRSERQATVVLIEHRVEAAWPLADMLLALSRDGSVLDLGSPADVVARSADRLRSEGIWLPAAVEPRLGRRSQGLARGQALPAGEDRGSVSAAAALGRAMQWPVVAASGLTFGYQRGQPVVRDVGLVVDAGERVAVVGPNGSGKSTLGRLLVGMLRPSRGSVRLAGRDPWKLPSASLAREAGYVFQDPDLGFLADRVIDEVMAGLPESERPAAEEILDRLGLPPADFAARNPYRLSGGEARRLSLASALVRRPGLLVLDEPTYGQDRRGYEALLEILREHVSGGACVVAATHDERLVTDFARRRVEMAEGWIVVDEPVGADAP